MKGKTRKLVLAGLMAAILAILSQINLPIGPVPFNMAVFAVVLTGLLLPPVYALGSVAAYLLMGVVGLPVFAGFRGGPQVLVGPTGGYLIGYLAIALAVSLTAEYTQQFFLRVLGGVAGLAGCYLLGTLVFMAVTGNGFVASLAVCVFPFVITDLGKLVVAVSLVRMADKRGNGRRAWE